MSTCPKCGIAHLTPRCPRWAVSTLNTPAPRVCIRIGLKWPDCAGHAFAYFVDCRDDEWILAIDLATGDQSEVPLWTATTADGRKWTRPPSIDEEARALDELSMIAAGKFRIVRRIS